MTKPPTIQGVAEALGMHKSTVSLALSGKGGISAQRGDRAGRRRPAARTAGRPPQTVTIRGKMVARASVAAPQGKA